MKRAEKIPSVHQKSADDLVAFLARPHEYSHPLRIVGSEIKTIPYGKQRGREILYIHLAPRFRIHESTIGGDYDPYTQDVVQHPTEGWIIETKSPIPGSYDCISIYANLAEIALAILKDQKGQVVDDRWCPWVSLQEHLRSKGSRRIRVWNSDNCNDWAVLGAGDDRKSFIGACPADIEQSAVLLVAHSNPALGLAAANRQFQHCLQVT